MEEKQCAICGKPATFALYDTAGTSFVTPAPVRGYYCDEHNPVRVRIEFEWTKIEKPKQPNQE